MSGSVDCVISHDIRGIWGVVVATLGCIQQHNSRYGMLGRPTDGYKGPQIAHNLSNLWQLISPFIGVIGRDREFCNQRCAHLWIGTVHSNVNSADHY